MRTSWWAVEGGVRNSQRGDGACSVGLERLTPPRAWRGRCTQRTMPGPVSPAEQPHEPGTLLHQKKELELHCDLKQGDRLLYFSTLGWMMWNWSAAALSVRGASLVAYDGSPGYPDLAGLWRVVAREGITHFGASPK